MLGLTPPHHRATTFAGYDILKRRLTVTKTATRNTCWFLEASRNPQAPTHRKKVMAKGVNTRRDRVNPSCWFHPSRSSSWCRGFLCCWIPKFFLSLTRDYFSFQVTSDGWDANSDGVVTVARTVWKEGFEMLKKHQPARGNDRTQATVWQLKDGGNG